MFIARALGLETLAKSLRYSVFPGMNGSLESADLSDALRASTFKHLGYEMGLMYWREIQTHFSRRFMDGGEDDTSEPAHYTQRGHSMETGYKFYGRAHDAPIGTPYQTILAQLRSSRIWQDFTGTHCHPPYEAKLTSSFTGIEPLSPDERKKYMALGLSEENVYARVHEMLEAARKQHEATTALINRHAGMQKPTPAPNPPISMGTSGRDAPRTDAGPLATSDIIPHPSNLTLLRDFLQNPDASFTCPEQAQALEHVLTKRSSLVLIGPTAMGKSAVFLIPAMLKGNMVTIVLVPLSGLRFDFVQRCRKLGVRCTEWREAEKHQDASGIVMVSPENACKPKFMAWATNQRLMGKLFYIVCDEMHLFATQEAFRKCLSQQSIVQIGTLRNPVGKCRELTCANQGPRYSSRQPHARNVCWER